MYNIESKEAAQISPALSQPDEKLMIKQAFILIEKHGKLSPNGEYFVKSLRKSFARHKSLSERQQKALYEIRDSLI